MLIVNPAVLGITGLLLAIIWMLADETDRVRPLLVFALLLNLVYGAFLKFVMMGESSLFPWKYDFVLYQLDRSLGIPTAAIAATLVHSALHTLLTVVYHSLLPAMIFTYILQRKEHSRPSILRAYIAEMTVGPVFYGLLPACGPIYCFGESWLHPTIESARIVRLSAMPNAFPSLHAATALLFVFVARSVLWRAASLVFLLGTLLATISTGEHFAVDLVADLAFGCFAIYAGRLDLRRAMVWLATVALWSVLVRFRFQYLLAHRIELKTLTVVTILAVAHAVWRSWTTIHANEAVRILPDAVNDTPPASFAAAGMGSASHPAPALAPSR